VEVILQRWMEDMCAEIPWLPHPTMAGRLPFADENAGRRRLVSTRSKTCQHANRPASSISLRTRREVRCADRKPLPRIFVHSNTSKLLPSNITFQAPITSFRNHLASSEYDRRSESSPSLPGTSLTGTDEAREELNEAAQSFVW